MAMSPTTSPVTTPTTPPTSRDEALPRRDPKRDPEPPDDGEDRTRWRIVGRGRGVPQPPPLVSVEVDFDRGQSDWLTEEAGRTGLDYVSLLQKLVDDARAPR